MKTLMLAPMILFLLVGCSTPRPEGSTLLTPEEKEQLTRRAKPPQTFGLTAYNSEDGAVFAGAFRQHQNHMGRVAFASPKDSTAPIIPANEKELFLLIDSSAGESWLTVEAFVSGRAHALTGPAPFEKNARHVHDTVGGFAAVLPKLILENAHVENGVFYVRQARGSLDELTRWEKEPPIDGVLGADFLRSFEFVRISLRGRQAVFSGTSVYPYPANAITTLPVETLNGGMAVEAFLDGEKQPVLIDIAGDFEVAMENPPSSTLRQVTLGDVVFRRVEVVPAFELGLGKDSPPRIGRQLLERYDLVFSQKGRQLLLEKPTQ